MKINLKGMDQEELRKFVESLGEPKYRADQLFLGIYRDGYSSFEEFSNLSGQLKSKLNECAEIRSLKLNKHLVSKDGTQKMTFSLGEDREIESVWIPSGDEERKTICISSQVGCTLSCAFCATGTLEFKGNLKAWEIVDQVISVERITGEKCTNIVFMGMGEPFHNYNQVIKAAHLFHHPSTWNLGAKRITISTSGVIPSILRFIEENQPFNFALSLNDPRKDRRHEIMNIDKRFPLDELLGTVRHFTKTLKRKITFEYIMIPDVNMDKNTAATLVKLARSVNCKINLIPLNTEFNGWRPPTEKEIDQFKSLLKPAGVPIMNRKSPGKDISGACGMLALKG
ncbi:MAG: 23S rRNA (adenine(2503)-C(2))-methyltransferase RlmN [Leptospiraceae bacterium]|nr:23S rRNA (adenine(2503)-C(2))-methyltransferase RlmN [Leptospiraceae bacterium]MCP5511498.1 23S rRNA (adenine(2503)-C(2))-methyltransferase RlmN [Leptospiraceae bacterium]